MSDIWTPSDELLFTDSAAQGKVDNPTGSLGLALPGSIGGDLDDEAAEERAAVVLAEEDGDEPVGVEVESGVADDDGEVDDSSDAEPVGDDV